MLREFSFTSVPASARYGQGLVDRMAEALAEVGGTRALVITGRSIATRTDLVERIQRALGSAYAGCFDRVVAHVLESNVHEGLAMLRETGADAMICVGGGSPENAAEAIALLHAEGGQLADHQVAFDSAQGMRIPDLRKPKLPIVAVPTTLSGAEVAAGFSVTAESPRRKLLFRDPLCRPRLVLLDPTAAAHTDVSFLASTGLNALDHCVEGLYSKAANAVSDALYLHAARELYTWLVRLPEAPDDLETRGRLQIGGFLAALAHLHCRPALNHAIAHHLGGTLDVPHGLAHGIPLQHTMRFNREVAADRLALLAEAWGVAMRHDDPQVAAQRAIDALQGLFAATGLPARLRDVGVAEADLPRVAEATMHDYGVGYNPRPATAADVLAILRAAW